MRELTVISILDCFKEYALLVSYARGYGISRTSMTVREILRYLNDIYMLGLVEKYYIHTGKLGFSA